MKKALPIILLLNVLMLVGLAGFLVGTGRLDKQKALTVLDLLKHQGTPDKLREQTYEILEHTASTTSASASATAPATRETESEGSGQDQLATARRAMEAERLKLEIEAQALRERQKLLQDLDASVTSKLHDLKARQDAFDQQTKAVAAKTHSDAFNKALTLYNELKPKQVKEIFTGLPSEGAVDLVAEYLLAMDSERAGKIIAEFKTEKERSFITAVLERIRSANPQAGRDNHNPGSAIAAGEQPRS